MNKKKVLIESLPVLLIASIGGAASGLVLGGMRTFLERIPGLIIMVPPIIALRGNISSVMGARLGSAYHLGMLEEGLSSDIVSENFKGSLSLSAFIGAILPFFLWLTSLFLPFTVGFRGLSALIMISVLTGLTSGLLLSSLALFIIFLSAKFNLDPDNISGPFLTSMGDLSTLLVLFLFARIIGGLIL